MKKRLISQSKRHFISDKIIIGVDPAKEKHQAIAINSVGDPLSKSFRFENSYFGFQVQLWHKLERLLAEIDIKKIVFAVEISINYWQKLCCYLHQKGFTVLMTSPLATKYERPKMAGNFSKTDPKDALAVANNARQGYFNYYKEHSPFIEGINRLGITYDKLRKDYVRARQRIRSLVELVFPEFLDVLPLSTKTAIYLLGKYMTPEEFQNMNLFTETIALAKIYNREYGAEKIKALKETAHNSIGIPLKDEHYLAHRLSLNTWIMQLQTTESHQEMILDEMVRLASQTPYYEILTSIKGISATSASRFIAETRALDDVVHYKQLEAYAGVNLRLLDSGKFSGYRRTTHKGNARLRAILYKMVEESKNHIPEIRIKYLKRQLQKPLYRKNIIACSSNLFKLIMALIKEHRTYEFKESNVKEMRLLETRYYELKEKRMKRQYRQAS